MARVEFSYDGETKSIQCSPNDRFVDILCKISIKMNFDQNSVNILYSGNVIQDKNLTFMQLANEIDKKRNIMNIQILDSTPREENDLSSKSNFKSKYVICPICRENTRIGIDDYKIRLYDCINFHCLNNLSIEDYEETQIINEEKIICDSCQKQNKATAYKNLFYRCNICNQNLCVLCKDKHDSNHNLMNFEDKNYICKIHNEPFTFYCQLCKKNICLSCEAEHSNHDLISFGKMIPDKESLLNILKENRNI